MPRCECGASVCATSSPDENSRTIPTDIHVHVLRAGAGCTRFSLIQAQSPWCSEPGREAEHLAS